MTILPLLPLGEEMGMREFFLTPVLSLGERQ